MARVNLSRSLANLNDAQISVDPGRMMVIAVLGPVRFEFHYTEAKNLYARLGDALDRLYSIKDGPEREGGDGVSRDVMDEPSSASVS